MKSILIATDGSDAAHEALEFAIELCKDSGASLDVLSVHPPALLGRAGAGPPILEVEELHGSEHIAAAAAAHAQEQGVTARAHSAHGEPVDAIVAESARLEADLIVVGSRGLGAVSSALMGSVSRSLVTKSRVPVTVVKAATHAHASKQAYAETLLT